MAQFRQGYSQTNVDGQQLTINYHSQTDTEQPGFSRDAIAEFEVVANRFDATQGRSSGHGGQRHHEIGDEQLCRVGRRLLPRRQVQRRRLHLSTACSPIRTSRSARRSADRSEGSHSLLRRLRIRAGTEDLRLQQPVSGVQHRPGIPDADCTRPWDASTISSRRRRGCRRASRFSRTSSMRAAAPHPTRRPVARGSASARSTTLRLRRCSAAVR